MSGSARKTYDAHISSRLVRKGVSLVMNSDGNKPLTEWVRAACVLEASARKPGNVHPGVSFADLSYADFLRSAEVVAPIISQAPVLGVGETVLRAVATTREQVGRNTNLGIILLLAPLAAVPLTEKLAPGVARVLDELTREDAVAVYRAIRIAQAGGLGNVDEGDVFAEPAGTLREMMTLAAHRDRIASEYNTNFSVTLQFGAAFLSRHPNWIDDWEAAVIELQLRLMAEYPDTLIARKCGPVIAEESAQRARRVLDSEPAARAGALREFDDWLRADGHRRNPGTTADLVAGSLFAAIRGTALVADSFL